MPEITYGRWSPTEVMERVLDGTWVAATFTPADLSPVLWFDASDTSTITQSGGDVSQWDDKSGNGYHVSQATASYQPKTATRTINGLNVIEFDGSNDALDSGVVITEFSSSKAFTAFLIVESDSTALGTQGFLSFSRSGSTYDFNSGFLMERRTSNIATSLGYGGTSSASSNYLAQQRSNSSLDPMLFTFDASASAGTSNVWIDSVSQTMSTFDGTMAVTSFLGTSTGDHKLRIGGRLGFTYSTSTAPFDGVIGEIVVYDYVLSVAERGQVETYLTDKWAI